MKIETAVRKFDVGRKLRVGVMSDSQLSSLRFLKSDTFEKNTAAAFKTFAKLGCNMILFAGDICNSAGASGYKKFRSCIFAAYGDNPPLIQCIMGNHDYYLRPFARRLFERMLGQSPFTHYEVNGFHFIGASPDSGSMRNGYRHTAEWLDGELKKACASASARPVFVMTHNAAENTVYGSEDWGDVNLGKTLSKWPCVINFSGHTHYSLLDERSVYAGDYIALNTQSVSYIELEKGKQNGSVPPLAYTAPMGYVLDFDDGTIAVKRINLLDGAELMPDRRINIKYGAGGIKLMWPEPYLPPETAPVEGKYFTEGSRVFLTFSAPCDGAFVHSYKAVFSDGTEQRYFSSFYLGKGAERQTVLPVYGKKAGTYDVRIYPTDSQGRQSAECVTVKDVTVPRRIKYRRILAPEIKY